MLSRILANTPVWVWGLLVALIALGIAQSRPRSISLRRAMILPAAMTVLSAWGTASGFGMAPPIVLSWLTTAGLMTAWLMRRPARTRYDAAAGRFHLPGSWMPLALILGIFSVKYVVGVLLAMQAALAADTGFAVTAAALYGALSGVFLGRAGRLWRIARHPEPAAYEMAGERAAPVAAAFRVAMAGVTAIAGMIAAMIAFGAPHPPPPLKAVSGAVMATGYRDLPVLEHAIARDGVPLAYRRYRSQDDSRVAVLVHGSSGDSHAMHKVGLALAQAGITAYALDMRGHGASGSKGDIGYAGQLDDDIADIAALLRARHPRAQLSLIGHSSGGGFTLRTAGGRNRDLFDRYLLLAPMLHQEAPTTRPNAGGWVSVAVARIIGLRLLEGFGLPWFQHLPVLAFALPPEAANRATTTYSYRLQSSFRPHEDYLGDVRAITRPTRVLVGAKDELFIADQYAPLLEPVQSQLQVKVLPGVSHIGIVVQPDALAAIVAAL